ncbi:hypothetical protein [Neisseria subflava]|uniref:hypothetical protein n=1 Tax=Neisseria subflava TaxID=28449 RepID=UPI003D80AB72
MKHIFHPIVGDTNYGDCAKTMPLPNISHATPDVARAKPQFSKHRRRQPDDCTSATDNDWRLWMEKFKTEAV